MKNILTSPTAAGVLIRYLSAMLGAVVGVLVVMGYFTEEQATMFNENIELILGALGTIAATVIPIYASLNKSMSSKAEEVAKAVDKEVPPGATVTVVTPEDQPNIVVQGDK